MDVIEQSSEMAGIAFLLGRKQFASLEKSYSVQQYEKILLRLYAPHHDKIGYRSPHRLRSGERLEEIGQAFQKNEILPNRRRWNRSRIRSPWQWTVCGWRLTWSVSNWKCKGGNHHAKPNPHQWQCSNKNLNEKE